ncbi:hypothetical protein PHYBLDRAFT_167510 [Phycomyces blakesleeanus NRRL 1555(-)]|uniref:Uncharacterized protein n=1 Tax=Phycomyces blakesleeanus (strain ATCC 8743b / DSM 1359 / FGSC 10004 / NBRC 33097 / NRRL 1555) TaxID=763407 RepID=A0A163DXR0_PHYB8|nr:hypothetical protein PHYBLDRAFT_167510 [Phycomyces blakesleeanus NRRL 1555(-)]OAD74080.1 hypothetical protein PHYBLDRAFT_167510 [Phycomyces blakesleeanus NRRL 1555(-)]|eukprot:XP_018292120.1 hypothetical protein PHYBLDRAFT_167510 [Phycomyces blakesleeanus NRRL 1555(-)]
MRCFVEDIYKSNSVNSALTSPTQAPFLPVLSKLVCSSTPVLTLPSASSTIVQPPFILQAFVDSSETIRIPILGNEPLPPTSFPLSVSKPSSMGDIDYPHLLEYYKLAYLTPDLVHYQNAAASPFFVDNQIIKSKSINILGQVYYGNNDTTGHGSYVQSLFLGSDGSTETTFTCQIKYISIHSFTPPPMLPYYEANSTHHDQHVFAFVNWLLLLGDKSQEKDGVDICGSTPLPSNYHSILPVHRISLEVAIANHTTGLVQKKLVITLLKKLYA